MAYYRGSLAWGAYPIPVRARPANSIPIDMQRIGIE